MSTSKQAAYDVMSFAKRQGAQKRNEEDWEKYQEALRSHGQKEGKAGFWGGLGKLGMSMLSAALIPATGGASLLGGIGAGAGRSILNYFGGDIVNKMFGGGKPPPEFTSSGGLYGGAQRRRMESQGRSIASQLIDQQKAGQRGDMFSSLLSGFMPEIKGAWGKNIKSKLTGLGKKAFGDSSFIGPTLPKGFTPQAPSTGSIGETFSLGKAPFSPLSDSNKITYALDPANVTDTGSFFGGQAGNVNLGQAIGFTPSADPYSGIGPSLPKGYTPPPVMGYDDPLTKLYNEFMKKQ